MVLLTTYYSVAKIIVIVYIGINILTRIKTVFYGVQIVYQIKDRFSVALIYLKREVDKYEIFLPKSIHS